MLPKENRFVKPPKVPFLKETTAICTWSKQTGGEEVFELAGRERPEINLKNDFDDARIKILAYVQNVWYNKSRLGH